MSTASPSETNRTQQPIGDETTNTFGPYRLDRLVAQTATGTVFSATHNQLKRRFTLNVLNPLADRDPACVLNFTREMATATEINHPNVMRVVEAGVVKDLHYIAAEYVDGIDVNTIATRDGKVAPAIACEIIRQAAVGVHCIHQNNLLHHGINPANLLLSKKGVVKIDGLGVAALGTEQSGEGEAINYLAPEQLAGRAERRSDIYGLGCTLYRLLTGELPPKASDRRSNAEEKSFLSMVAPELSPDLVDMLQHMMEVDPDRRLQSPSQAVAAMCSWAGGEKLPKLVSRHSNMNVESTVDTGAHLETTKIESSVTSESQAMESKSETPKPKVSNADPKAAATTKPSDSPKVSASRPDSVSWLWPAILVCAGAAVVGYTFSNEILGLFGSLAQNQPDVVVLKANDASADANAADPLLDGQNTDTEQTEEPIVVGDTYHTKLQQQLRDEYGLTGGQWVLTPNEVALISNVVTYGAGVSQTTTEDTDFNHLIRMNVGDAGSNPWDAGLYVPNVQGIQEGDRVLMVVWLRTSPASVEEIGKLNVYVEDANSDEKEVYLTVNPTAEWRQFLIPFEANATAKLRVGFHLAFQEQEIDYAGLTLINYGTSVPFWDAKSSTMQNQ